MPSALRITGTTNPLGADTAIEMSVKSLNTISSPSIEAFTAGNSFKATLTAFVKKDIKPKPTPCFSLNWSLNLDLKSITGFMSTSLKVVNMAVSFLTATNLLAMVFLSGDIFCLVCSLLPATGGVGAALATGATVF